MKTFAKFRLQLQWLTVTISEDMVTGDNNGNIMLLHIYMEPIITEPDIYHRAALARLGGEGCMCVNWAVSGSGRE